MDIIRSISNPSTINDLIAGSLAGAAQVVVGQPLDTVKTRAQIAPRGMFKGPMDILLQTVRKEGFFALYKGMASPLIGIAGVNSLLFTAYSVSKRIISPFPELTLDQTAVAGAMAGAVNSLLASPVELFKIRMQGQYGGADDKRLSKTAMNIYKKFGFRHGVMKGFWATVAREIPAYAGFYTGFEFAKRQFRSQIGEPLPAWALLLSGSLGGISYWLACYPLDVVKSRIQLSDQLPRRRFGYIPDEFHIVFKEQGIRGLYRGITPTLIRSVPAAAVTFFTFEKTRAYLQRKTGI